MERLFKTYQQFMNNLYSMTNFHKQLKENANEISKTQENLYKQQNIGFSINEEEYYEEEEE